MQASKRLGFCGNTVPTISDIFSNADDCLFKAVLKNSHHVNTAHEHGYCVPGFSPMIMLS